MIDITLEFFDRQTEFLEKKFEIQMPEGMIFKITETKDIQEIRTFGYDVTPEFIVYVQKHYSDIAQNFEFYDAQFTGTLDTMKQAGS